jgi:hypothetical protein
MSELRPLLETSDDELTRALLDSARDELPNPAGLREAALVLGVTLSSAKALAAVPTVAGAGHAGAAAAASAAGSTSGAAAVGSASLLTLGKAIAGGALVSFVALSASQRALPTREIETGPTRTGTSQPASTTAPTAPVPEPRGGPGTTATSVVESTPTLVTKVRRTRTPPVAAPSPASTATQAPLASARATFALPAASASAEPARPAATSVNPSASLAAEIRLLDQVRTALGKHDFGQAARLLDAYARGPGQVLARDATRLRVQLLLASGQRAAAATLARREVVQHPEGADAALRQLADEP